MITQTPDGKSSNELKANEGIVLYTDGSCLGTNPGHIGWGYHGYHYKIDLPKKGTGHPSHTLSSGGYVPKANKGEEVTPIEYFDAFGSQENLATNNVAELLAANHALYKAADYKVGNLLIKSDSDYMRKGVMEWSPHWIRNNWVRTDGTPVPNAHTWKILLNNLNRVKANGTKVDIEWVKGHNNNFGNEAADKLANVGSINSTQGNYLNFVKGSKPEGYWKKENEKHPFFFNKSLFFNTLQSSQIKGEYLLGDHEKEEELIGKKTSDGSYSVLQFVEPEPIIELVRSYQTSFSGEIDSIIMVRLDRLFNPTIYREIEDFGKAAVMRRVPNRIDLYTLDKEPLTRELRPPRIAARAIECLSSLKSLLSLYREGTSTKLSATDITSVFYEDEIVMKRKEEVRNTVLKPEYIVGYTAKEVVANVILDTGVITMPITLTLGMDIASRNSLKRLETMQPKLVLLTWQDAPDVIRYATVIESQGNYCITAGMYTNTIYREP